MAVALTAMVSLPRGVEVGEGGVVAEREVLGVVVGESLGVALTVPSRGLLLGVEVSLP